MRLANRRTEALKIRFTLDSKRSLIRRRHYSRENKEGYFLQYTFIQRSKSRGKGSRSWRKEPLQREPRNRTIAAGPRKTAAFSPPFLSFPLSLSLSLSLLNRREKRATKARFGSVELCFVLLDLWAKRWNGTRDGIKREREREKGK